MFLSRARSMVSTAKAAWRCGRCGLVTAVMSSWAAVSGPDAVSGT